MLPKESTGGQNETMIWLLALVLNTSIVNAAEKSSAGTKVSQGLKAMLRVGLGYGFSEIKDVEPSSVTDFNKPRSFWQETDFMLPVSVHFAVRETWDDSVNVDFHGNGIKPGEIYMTALQLGAKFTVPFWVIQPWVGAGVTGGFVALSNPADRNFQDWKVAFDKVTKAVRGLYWHAGIDIMTPLLSLRVGTMTEKIATDRYDNLNSTALKFEHTMLVVGIVGNVK